MGRKFQSWLAGFDVYTENLPSPVLFRKWAAIATVAGVLERKVWIKSNIGILYPNLYTILVAPAGVGKTVMTDLVRAFWEEIPELHIAKSSVNRATVIDELLEAERNIVRPQDKENPVVSFNSLLIAANELSVLIPGFDLPFMSVMTDLWDCKHYSERRRGRDINFTIENPQINMIAATTPSYLKEMIPEGAWEQGFTSRTLLIYSGEIERRPIFGETQKNEAMFKLLVEDLKHIASLYGKMSFTPESVEAINEWHMSGGEPRPNHPRLNNYLNRRTTAHVLKLAMISSIMERDDLVITAENFFEARDWLIEFEHYIPDIFKSMTGGGDARAIEEAWHFLYTIYIKDSQRRPIIESRLVHFLSERVPVHSVHRIIEIMVKAKIIKEELIKGVGKGYVPNAKTAA